MYPSERQAGPGRYSFSCTQGLGVWTLVSAFRICRPPGVGTHVSLPDLYSAPNGANDSCSPVPLGSRREKAEADRPRAERPNQAETGGACGSARFPGRRFLISTVWPSVHALGSHARRSSEVSGGVGAATSQPSLTGPCPCRSQTEKCKRLETGQTLPFFPPLFLPEIRCGLTAYISILASLGKRTQGSPRLPPPAPPPPLAEGSAHDAAAGEEALVGTGCLHPPFCPPSCTALLRELGWARLVLSASSKLLMSWRLPLGFADRVLNAFRIM